MKILPFILVFATHNMTVGLYDINKTYEKQNSTHKFNKVQNLVNQLISHPQDFMNLICWTQ